MFCSYSPFSGRWDSKCWKKCNWNPELWEDFSQLQIQFKQNPNLNLYREIPRNSNPIKISIRLCTVRYREIWFSRFWQVKENLPTIQDFYLHFFYHFESHLSGNGLYLCFFLQSLCIWSVESYKQCYVYNDIPIEVSFQIEKGEMNMQQNTKHAARITQTNRQVEKKTYTHNVNSHRCAFP